MEGHQYLSQSDLRKNRLNLYIDWNSIEFDGVEKTRTKWIFEFCISMYVYFSVQDQLPFVRCLHCTSKSAFSSIHSRKQNIFFSFSLLEQTRLSDAVPSNVSNNSDSQVLPQNIRVKKNSIKNIHSSISPAREQVSLSTRESRVKISKCVLWSQHYLLAS